MKTYTTLAAQLGRCALLAGFLPLAAAATHEGRHAQPGFHLGAGGGSNSVNGSDYTGDGNHVDDTQRAYKALAGYRFSEMVSLEAQYIDFGTARDGGNSVKAHGVTVGGVLEAPITRYVHPYAKAGVLFWDADGSFNGVNRNDDGRDFTYGGGLRFVLGRNVDVRGEYERFELNETDVHTISAVLQLNF